MKKSIFIFSIMVCIGCTPLPVHYNHKTGEHYSTSIDGFGTVKKDVKHCNKQHYGKRK